MRIAIRIPRELLRRRHNSRGRCRGRWRRSRSCGREPKARRMLPTPDSTMRLTVPRQPAWKAATTRLLAVGDEDGNAIGGLNGEEQARLGGDLPVGFVRVARGQRRQRMAVDDAVGMKLAERDERSCGIGRDGFGEETPVAEDGFAIVSGGEAEVQFAHHGGQAGRGFRNRRGSGRRCGSRILPRAREGPSREWAATRHHWRRGEGRARGVSSSGALRTKLSYGWGACRGRGRCAATEPGFLPASLRASPACGKAEIGRFEGGSGREFLAWKQSSCSFDFRWAAFFRRSQWAENAGRESMWAYLPVGPLERQFWEGDQGGILGRGSEEPSRESCCLALAGHLGKPLLITYIDALFEKELQVPNCGRSQRAVEMRGVLVAWHPLGTKMGNLLETTGANWAPLTGTLTWAL